MKLPRCCGQEMETSMETAKFLEASCGVCGDTVYIKKERIEKPQLLDD